MTDIVVTIGAERWDAWLRDHGAGDGIGRNRSFRVHGERPPVSAGDQLYVLAFERIRCAFEIEHLREAGDGWWIVFARMSRSVFVTGKTPGFRGWCRRWWDLKSETPFPAWRLPYGGETASVQPCPALAHGKTASMQGGSSV